MCDGAPDGKQQGLGGQAGGPLHVPLCMSHLCWLLLLPLPCTVSCSHIWQLLPTSVSCSLPLSSTVLVLSTLLSSLCNCSITVHFFFFKSSLNLLQGFPDSSVGKQQCFCFLIFFCHKVCGILAPSPGIELHWMDHQGSPLFPFFFFF